eukprot:comp22550_c0_seq3/m.34301 comp22550_c0_seq3/g.34301  ORF comp22550_c0_seq3/g.34301 comp22550_c0_seq3/m.34301 type:complete len:171 (-) comp22550_c0_seq3:747-1259(-)
MSDQEKRCPVTGQAGTCPASGKAAAESHDKLAEKIEEAKATHTCPFSGKAEGTCPATVATKDHPTPNDNVQAHIAVAERTHSCPYSGASEGKCPVSGATKDHPAPVDEYGTYVEGRNATEHLPPAEVRWAREHLGSIGGARIWTFPCKWRMGPAPARSRNFRRRLLRLRR